MTPTFEPWQLLEALLFASDSPIEAERIQEVLGLDSPAAARGVVDELRQRLEDGGRALQVVEAGGGFRLLTRPEAAPWLVRLQRSRTRARLSRPALETLAIVAYRQPVSKPELDVIRGVNSEGVLESLLERRLIRMAGRKEAPGRPFLYETTREFLVAFGLRDLGDLPKVEGELIVPEVAAPADAQPAAAAPESDPAGDTAQQDPVASGPDVAPRS
jgi:segregation and condensation protein B